MDLTLSPEQDLLVRSARGVLARACTLANVRALEHDPHGFDREQWRALGDLGWLGLELPAEYGGGGLSFVETVLLLEEMGRVLLPSPFVTTVVQAAPLILTLGNDTQRRRWLPAIAAGECVASLALAEEGWHDVWQLPALRAADGRLANGRKVFVPFAAGADVLLVAVAGPALVALARDTPGVAHTRLATLDTEPLYAVDFSGARGEPLGAAAAVAPQLAHALDRGAIGSLAYVVGVAERALEMTVDYAQTREQFGRPIGSFQAVAHRCVDMRSDLDALRYLVYQAAWTLAAGRDSALAVGAAQAYGAEAIRRIFMHAHQVHGAIGFSTEHDLHLFTRRAKAIELQWGGAAQHRERVARAMGL